MIEILYREKFPLAVLFQAMREVLLNLSKFPTSNYVHLIHCVMCSNCPIENTLRADQIKSSSVADL